MLKFGNREFRNLQEQVEKNMKDILFILQEEGVLNEFGIKVVGQEELVTDMPTVTDYKENNPDWAYGDAYAVGDEEPYILYVLTRANGTHPNDYWFNIGEFPAPGPQGPEGPEGPQGPQGQTGATGADGLPAGFGTVSATATTLDAGEDATVSVSTSGPDTAMNIAFDFGIPKGDSGSGQSTEWGSITGTLADQTDLVTALQGKQNTLVSGTNIKTINSQSILGSGDLTITAGVSDVQVNGTSVVTGGVAEVTVPTNYVTTDTNQTITGNKTLTGTTSFGSSGAISVSGSGINVYSPAAIRTYGADVNLSGSLVLGSSKIKTNSSDTYGLTIPSTSSLTENKTIATTDDITNVSGTNDGTNWTSITIGSSTYDIPSGGGGGGGVTLDTDQTITGNKTFSGASIKLGSGASICNTSNRDILSTASGRIELGDLYMTGGISYLAYPEIRCVTDSLTGYSTTGSPADLGNSSRHWRSLYVDRLKDGNAANYTTGLLLPDMTNWTADKTIATTDDIPVIPATIVEDVQVNGTSVVTAGVAEITVPTDTSDLTNNAGFITSSALSGYAKLSGGVSSSTRQVFTGYNEFSHGSNNFGDVFVGDGVGQGINISYNKISYKPYNESFIDYTLPSTSGTLALTSDIPSTISWSNVTDKPTFATVATSGSYNDLSNKPTIPTKTSDLNNDSGFITSNDLSGYAELAGGTSSVRQEFTGYNTFTHPVRVGSNLRVGTGDTGYTMYYSNMITRNISGTNYQLTLPSVAGTIALTSDIPSLTGYATETWVTNQGYLTSVSWNDVSSKPTFATVATSGDYDDLLNKPTIPDAVSGTNDGTNWTSLTIGSVTKAIPQGGSSGVTDVELDGTSIVTSGVAELTSETWTFTLSDGTTITKKILVG